MDGWNQLSAILLLFVCADSRVTVVKTTVRGPETTPVCVRENLGNILFVSCRISTGRLHSKECHLLYKDESFKCDPHDPRNCDSRFRLINVNHTVFIQLTSLTPEDSGNYTCECSYEKGTHVLHLGVIVDYGDGSFSSLKFVAAVIVVTVATTIISAAGIMCFILKRNKRENESRASELRRSETLDSVVQEDSYTNLQYQTSDVYQTLSCRPHGAEAGAADIVMTEYEYFRCQEVEGKELDLSPIYETILN